MNIKIISLFLFIQIIEIFSSEKNKLFLCQNTSPLKKRSDQFAYIRHIQSPEELKAIIDFHLSQTRRLWHSPYTKRIMPKGLMFFLGQLLNYSDQKIASEYLQNMLSEDNLHKKTLFLLAKKQTALEAILNMKSLLWAAFFIIKNDTLLLSKSITKIRKEINSQEEDILNYHQIQYLPEFDQHMDFYGKTLDFIKDNKKTQLKKIIILLTLTKKQAGEMLYMVGEELRNELLQSIFFILSRPHLYYLKQKENKTKSNLKEAAIEIARKNESDFVKLMIESEKHYLSFHLTPIELILETNRYENDFVPFFSGAAENEQMEKKALEIIRKLYKECVSCSNKRKRRNDFLMIKL